MLTLYLTVALAVLVSSALNPRLDSRETVAAAVLWPLLGLVALYAFARDL